MKVFEHHALAREFWEKGFSRSCPIWDMHCHMNSHPAIAFPCAEMEAMVLHLRRVNARAVFAHHWALFSPEFSQSECARIAAAYPQELRFYVALNPNYPAHIERDLAAFESWRPWAVGFKALADYHGVPVTDAVYRPAWEFADRRGLPVLFHTWNGSPCDGQGPMRELMERYPNIRFLLGHSFYPNWASAIQVVRDFPEHVYLELTSIPGTAGAVEKLVDGVGSKRILFGTDLPWFDEYQALGGILGSRLDEEAIHDILHRNAEDLLGWDGV